MKLGVKIGVGFGIIMLLLVLISVIAVVQLNNLSVETANITKLRIKNWNWPTN